ncbi:hypothetical protein ACFP63_14615 [Oerskovia jenensis]|uniref:GerMN domain-containing protein n=1 Tax=Oerskovia jenensis TaxID=162169 RepID=A0ABS2L9N5_9CELL|nr:hypothetical protein [Oerskovia jenensis]MBM7477144.1 hypothetical protein [Oerskovia jenensis]
MRRSSPSSEKLPGRPRPAPALVVSTCLLVAVLAGCTAPADRSDEPDAGARPPSSDPVVPADGPVAETPMPTFDDSSVAGSLVEGFPVDVVPVPPDAEVLASSATDVEGAPLRQVTLNLSSPAAVQEILDFYTQSMTAAGFAALPGSVPGGLSGQAAFNRAAADGATETLSVGVLDTTDSRLVTISGQVLPPA